MKNKTAVVLILAFWMMLSHESLGQNKGKISYFDSLDHKLDMSDVLIHARGFIPVPIIVTEPALGGFGGGVAPIFITKRKPFISRDGKHVRIPPDVTGGAALYTVNNSWAA